MTSSLLISTYNSPLYLNTTLKSLLRQSRMPDEILIADDGSGEETRKLINYFKKKCPVPIKHIWHPDCGFRLAAIRNQAIRQSVYDYIIQIDGDIVMHPDFIADHLRYASPGQFAAASRAFLSPGYTSKILRSEKLGYDKMHRNCRIKLNAIRIPALTPMFFNLKSKHPGAVHGCNMAYWRNDALAVNGYNEDITGWGSEDCEFAIRLSNFGVRKVWLKFSAIEYHLYHREASHSNKAENNAIMTRAITEQLTFIPNGIDKK